MYRRGQKGALDEKEWDRITKVSNLEKFDYSNPYAGKDGLKMGGSGRGSIDMVEMYSEKYDVAANPYAGMHRLKSGRNKAKGRVGDAESSNAGTDYENYGDVDGSGSNPYAGMNRLKSGKILKKGQTGDADAYSASADYDAYGDANGNTDSNPYAGMERLRSARYQSPQGNLETLPAHSADGQFRPSAIVDWADRQYQSQAHQDVHNPFAGDSKLKQPRSVRVASDVNYTASDAQRPSAVVNMLDEYRPSRNTVAVAIAEGFDVNPMMMSERAERDRGDL